MLSSTLARASPFPCEKSPATAFHTAVCCWADLDTFAQVVALAPSTGAGGSSPSICRALMTRFIVWLWPCEEFDEGSAKMTNLSSSRDVAVSTAFLMRPTRVWLLVLMSLSSMACMTSSVSGFIFAATGVRGIGVHRSSSPSLAESSSILPRVREQRASSTSTLHTSGKQLIPSSRAAACAHMASLHLDKPDACGFRMVFKFGFEGSHLPALGGGFGAVLNQLQNRFWFLRGFRMFFFCMFLGV